MCGSDDARDLPAYVATLNEVRLKSKGFDHEAVEKSSNIYKIKVAIRRRR
jgi:hypothetical protein